jgi:hypothetical protein
MNMPPPPEAVGMTKVPLLVWAEADEASEVLEVDGVAGPAGECAAVDMSDSGCACFWFSRS